MGFEAQLGRLIREPGPAKKVAVIGGGPAGLQAAITAAERGHSVTLYEATGYLGGQLFHAESFAFKWPLRDFKNWQVRQAEKLGVEILLNTKATPALIQAGGYDAVIAATGAKPVFPKNIAGLRDENGNVKYPHAHDVFGREADLGKHVVIVGGSETGIETALYLLENGHDVTIVTRRERIGIDCSKAHYITKSWMDTRRGDGRADEAPEWAKYDNLITIPNATTTRVEGNRVFYTDATGTEQSVSGDSVVINGGVAPLQEEALGFYGIANKFVVIGDANGVGNLQKCIREGWSRACEI
jgi:NADPH-dependent 2,4-dienoyl-CoA reductase/sulfur reductase-like enzyme